MPNSLYGSGYGYTGFSYELFGELFTLDVYGHVSERMKADSAARMQGFIQNLANL